MYTKNTFEKVTEHISEKSNITSFDLIIKNYDILKGKSCNVKGVIINKRGLGKVIFMDIQDKSLTDNNTLQLYIRYDDMDKNVFENINKKATLGDTIYASGIVTKTKRGEVSLRLTDFHTILPGEERIEQTADNIYNAAKTGVKKAAHAINKFISEIK